MKEGEEEEGAAKSADAMLKTAVALMLKSQAELGKRRRKRVAGITDYDDTDEEDEDGDGLSRLPGAKGMVASERFRASMRRHPRTSPTGWLN